MRNSNDSAAHSIVTAKSKIYLKSYYEGLFYNTDFQSQHEPKFLYLISCSDNFPLNLPKLS